ncbi:MAG TPA: carboxypeptidase regulatory-like domain-containing protein [Gemmatimonadaceae bacterium]|nr:carboxypeptidase regulatory-like domain-containing protein [Gemmatimonadaceae bacterium]
MIAGASGSGVTSGRSSRRDAPALFLAAAGCVALLAMATAGRAQVVRGVVTDSLHSAIPGALVRLLASDSTSRGGAFTDDSGRFVIRAPEPGRYVVRARRVGFRAVSSPPLDLAAGQVREIVLLAHASVVGLPTVTVAGRGSCVAPAEQSVEAQRLWENSRSALDATAFTQEQQLVHVTIDEFSRDIALNGVVRRDHRERRTGVTGNPFVSAPAESLAVRGYVRADVDSTEYFAPDARVLLSESFASQHCWRVRPLDASKPGVVGLEFVPAPSRKLPDVAGVLWLDARTSELRFLQFQHTELPVQAPGDALLGRIEFTHLPSGAWIVSRWIIRMPLLGQDTARTHGLIAPKPTTNGLVGVREAGGEVIAMTGLTGAAATVASVATLVGTALDSTTGLPVAGATIALAGTNIATTTDAGGRFRLVDVPPPTAHLLVSDSLMPLLGVPPLEQDVAIRSGDSTTVTIGLPPPQTFAATMCADTMTLATRAIVVGRLSDARSGRTLADEPIQMSWTISSAEGQKLVRVPHSSTVQTDTGGVYRLCGVPVGIPLTLRIVDSAFQAARTSVVAQRGQLIVRNLRVDLGTGDSRLLVAVQRPDGRPLAGARVTVSGKEGSVGTDSSGVARFAALTAGTHAIDVQSVGLAPGQAAVDLAPAAETQATVMLGPNVQQLAGVTVTGRSTIETDFEKRRLTGGGYFITEEMLNRMPTQTVADAIAANAPATRLITNADGTERLVMRGLAGQIPLVRDNFSRPTLPNGTSPSSVSPSVQNPDPSGMDQRIIDDASGVTEKNAQATCDVAYWLDDERVYPVHGDISSLVRLPDVWAIEVYPSSISAPARYVGNHTECGIVLIWTKAAIARKSAKKVK